MTAIQRLQTVAGAHIHTANKAVFYREWWSTKCKDAWVTKLDQAVDKALTGDWKPLQTMLERLW